jgi:methylated-DNA-protein-cysteine methyltransferase-like protein
LCRQKEKVKYKKKKMPTPPTSDTKDFYQKVYALVRKIPKGKVCTYGIIGEALGGRISARMVGWAMNGAHHITPPVPAHRVVNRNGMLTGKFHFATPTLMADLLAQEGLQIENDIILNFKNHVWQP